MTLAERIARAQKPPLVCYYCRKPYTGRYDSHARSHDVSVAGVLPEWVRLALRGELRAKEL